MSSPATRHEPSLKIFPISHRLTRDPIQRYFLTKIQEAHKSLKTNAGWVNFRLRPPFPTDKAFHCNTNQNFCGEKKDCWNRDSGARGSANTSMPKESPSPTFQRWITVCSGRKITTLKAQIYSFTCKGSKVGVEHLSVSPRI
jgi:hypothetical protein